MYTMIVADDEKWIRERIISSINWNRIGVSVIGEAADGEEALGLCRKLRPDIVLTDIRMPGINGLDFLKFLKDEGINSRLIIISGYGEFQYAKEAIKLGVVDYILKPVENDELVNIVKKCIRQIEAETLRNRIIEQLNIQDHLPKRLEDYEKRDGNVKKRNTIERALAFIKENYKGPVSLNDLSEEVMMNPSYLSKLFTEVLGISFSKYLTLYRINRARELMNDPTLRIKEIAGMVGYDNVRYFTKVFKSATGFTPNTYKEQL